MDPDKTPIIAETTPVIAETEDLVRAAQVSHLRKVQSRIGYLRDRRARDAGEIKRLLRLEMGLEAMGRHLEKLDGEDRDIPDEEEAPDGEA